MRDVGIIIQISSLIKDKNDFFFPTVPTRFIRLWIFDNYGGDSIRIQSVEFYGVDSRLVDLLREYGLEKILPKLFANVMICLLFVSKMARS